MRLEENIKINNERNKIKTRTIPTDENIRCRGIKETSIDMTNWKQPKLFYEKEPDEEPSYI